MSPETDPEEEKTIGGSGRAGGGAGGGTTREALPVSVSATITQGPGVPERRVISEGQLDPTPSATNTLEDLQLAVFSHMGKIENALKRVKFQSGPVLKRRYEATDMDSINMELHVFDIMTGARYRMAITRVQIRSNSAQGLKIGSILSTIPAPVRRRG